MRHDGRLFMNIPDRLKKFRSALDAQEMDGAVILDRANTCYLSGFRGSSSIIIVMKDISILITDSRYYQQVKKDFSRYYDVILQKGDGREQMRLFFGVRGKKHIGFEPSISVEQFRWLTQAVRPSRLMDAGEILKRLRMRKDPSEIKAIRKAAAITDSCLAMLAESIRPGMTERRIASLARGFFEDNGAEGESFPLIIASGPNSAIPHHHPGDRMIGNNDIITMDIGCIWEGYCSDLTRTLFTGQPSRRMRQVYKTVLDALNLGVRAIRPGQRSGMVDHLVRSAIAESGFGEFFKHNTGHGVGIHVHEEPRLKPDSDTVLREGMVVTVEPGIYLPEEFGVRIEDLVLVTDRGVRRLSHSPRKLMMLS